MSVFPSAASGDPQHLLQANLRQRFARVRAHSVALASRLSAEDQCVQSMPDASPIKWHLAHTSWFFEAVVLVPHARGYQAFDSRFFHLFNSYYESLGPRHPRPQRGLLTRPSLEQVHAYREHVDAAMQRLIGDAQTAMPQQAEALVELGLQHEQQHQELMLTDILHAFSCNPPLPAYLPTDGPVLRLAATSAACDWIDMPGGVVEVGHGGDGFSYDNETPRHPHGARPLDPTAPVSQLSFYEAAAYAEWAGARLPTEFEWESAFHAPQIRQMTGHVWQWTRSPYHPYPGFRPLEGAVGEYNGKFMVGQLVLRGGSVATPPGHARPSYRNFFPPGARWQFSGLRLAKDLAC